VAETDKILREHEQGIVDAPWNRRLTLRLFREEATTLLKSAPAAVQEQPAPKEEEQPKEKDEPEEQTGPADTQSHE
jgi:hypothetical protein